MGQEGHQSAEVLSGTQPNLECVGKNTLVEREKRKQNEIEGLHERTEHLDIFLFFRTSLSGVLFLMFCLLVEG